MNGYHRRESRAIISLSNGIAFPAGGGILDCRLWKEKKTCSANINNKIRVQYNSVFI